jgi:hypothetical protein
MDPLALAGVGATLVSAKPQFEQKRAPTATGLPQFGQVRVSASPQFWQNLAPSALSV